MDHPNMPSTFHSRAAWAGARADSDGRRAALAGESFTSPYRDFRRDEWEHGYYDALLRKVRNAPIGSVTAKADRARLDEMRKKILHARGIFDA
jgi:hypothetical protein